MSLSIPAECQSCGRTFIHVRGKSGHVCELCGGHVSCGYPDCDKSDQSETFTPPEETREERAFDALIVASMRGVDPEALKAKMDEECEECEFCGDPSTHTEDFDRPAPIGFSG